MIFRCGFPGCETRIARRGFEIALLCTLAGCSTSGRVQPETGEKSSSVQPVFYGELRPGETIHIPVASGKFPDPGKKVSQMSEGE